MAMPLAKNVEIKRFSTLSELADIVSRLDAFYGTDTGVYHLAAAMGVPATVLFGPTRPKAVILPAQPNATGVRLSVLGDAHCDITECTRPLCLYRCVAGFAGADCGTPIEATPPACPLRAFEPAELREITAIKAAPDRTDAR